MMEEDAPEPRAPRGRRAGVYMPRALAVAVALLVGCDSGSSPSAHPSAEPPPDAPADARADAPGDEPAPIGTASLPLTVEEDEKVVAQGGGDRQGFGFAIALRGTRAVVTSSGHPAFQAPAATVVLERAAQAPTGWSEVSTLGPPDEAPRARLGPGSWVALLDDRALVGTGVAFGPGAAEAGAGLDVFDADGWSWSARLTPPPPLTPDRGPTVAADGDRLLVGGPAPPGPSSDTPGAAWIYERSGGGYALAATLVAPEEAPAGWAHALALDGDLAVVGSGVPGAFPPSSGVVHLFERSPDGSWALTGTLSHDDAGAAAVFGFSVALSGDRLLVGAPGAAPAGGAPTGAAYLFERGDDGTWSLADELTPPDGATQDRFGHAVALDGDVAAVGAPAHPVSPPDSPGARPVVGPGAVYVFTHGGPSTDAWSLATKLVPSDGETRALPTFANAPQSSQLGHAVALAGGVLLAGAPWDDNEGGVDAGAVYVMALDVDGDGVRDLEDLCPDTPASDAAAGVPGVNLRKHRWVYDGDAFVTVTAAGPEPEAPVTLQEVRGCSCAQIVARRGASTAHLRFGCSAGLLTSWAACAAAGVCP